MPYFVYKIHPDKKFDQIATFTAFKEAMALCRKMRQETLAEEQYQVRMMFAKDAAEARRLLTTKRAASPIEEWEV